MLTQNIRPRQLDVSEPFPVDPPPGDPATARSAIARDDLLITIVGANVGTAARVPQELPEHYVCQSLALIRLHDRTLSQFMELFLTAPTGGQSYFESCFYGQGRPHISFADLKKLPVPIPPPEERNAIIEVFERQQQAATQLVRTANAAAEEAQRLRRAILTAATTGVLAAPSAGAESAEEMLTRLSCQHQDAHAAKKRRAVPVGV